MDTTMAFARSMAAQGNESKVFDWDRAAALIAEAKPTIASAGLSEDWGWTGGTIFENGEPVDQGNTYTYLASNWATPELDMDGTVVDCFKMQSEAPQWHAETYWPESALAILKGDPA